MKGLMKASFDGSAMWRGGIGSLKEYVGECAGSRSIRRPQKRWIDTKTECLKQSGLDVRQARRMFQNRSEWQGFAWGIPRGMNP